MPTPNSCFFVSILRVILFPFLLFFAKTPRDETENSEENDIPIDTLVIVGNGFDLWQGLPTSFRDFYQYYLKNRDSILKKLHIGKNKCIYEDGEVVEYSDEEVIYGDPVFPCELDYGFWGEFETSLEKIEPERLTMYYGKTRSGLRQMNKTIRNAKRIIREAFCSWISTISIEKQIPEYQFGKNVFFINFNYTPTLQKRFGVDEFNVYHIHGDLSDKKNIIFGHSGHPQMPEYSLYKHGGSLRSLYMIEKLLYETDKQVEENILHLCVAFAFRGIKFENIKSVYVLGHSMSSPDQEYFAFLKKMTSPGRNKKRKERNDASPKENALESFYREQYIVNHIGHQISDDQIPFEPREAIRKKRKKEHAELSAHLEKKYVSFMVRHTKGKSREQIRKEFHDFLHPIRTDQAQWHITYYNDETKRRIIKLMKKIKCNNYQLYLGIDQCLAPFKAKA